MLRKEGEPFEVVNLTRKSKTDFSTKKHLGILMSNFEINSSPTPNTDLESRIFEFVGEDTSHCSNCGKQSSTHAILMGDYYDYDEGKKIWLPKKNEQGRPLKFTFPMLTPRAFKKKFGDLNPQKIQLAYQIPDEFWREIVPDSQIVSQYQDIEQFYKRILYQLVTYTPPCEKLGYIAAQ